MQTDSRPIPYHAARLIIGYSHNSLSEAEKDQLDEWVCKSDENMNIFADLTFEVTGKIFDPHQFISETEETIELWIIATLITKHLLKECDTMEEKYLNEWIGSSERHRLFFEMIQQSAFKGQVFSWVKMYWKSRFDLN